VTPKITDNGALTAKCQRVVNDVTIPTDGEPSLVTCTAQDAAGDNVSKLLSANVSIGVLLYD
jgi:hypothetical protein